MFEEALKVITAIKDNAAVVGILIALYGLRTWKKQLKWQADFGLAKRLLPSAISVKENYELLVNPIVLGSLGVEDEYKNRLNLLRESLNRLEPELIEAELLWKKNARKMIQPLREVYSDVLINMIRGKKPYDIENGEANLEKIKKSIDEIEKYVDKNFRP